MGAYTYVNDAIVGVKDMPGLKQWLEEMKAGKREEYINHEPNWDDTGKNRGPMYAEIITLDEKDETADFSGMNEWKIISYWYPLFCQFLRDVAVFLDDGDIELDFESNEEYGHIRFADGKCLITTGQMNFQPECDVTEIRPEIAPLPEDLQMRLCARKI